MADYKTVALDQETYDKIAKMAEDEGRTIGKQVSVIVDFAIKHRIISLSVLPHPPDADEVPVVVVE